MIIVENVTKSYAARTLFENISFTLNSKERLGLVGRNGHGKTTLFRLVVGEESPDSGSIIIPKNYRIGYVTQHLDFTEDTILKEGMKGLPPNQGTHHWKVEKVLAGLGFSESDMQRSPFDFSGGYQVRLNLAKILVSEPDLLLLDEPTNYLDITSIRWVEQFLVNWPREALIITHDRSFMDAVVTHTMAIHRKKLRKVQGNTEKLYSQIAQEEEIYEKTRLNDEKKRKEVEQFINRFRAKARLANLVQSRIKTLEKMEKKDKLDQIKDLDFTFRTRPLEGKHAMSANDISFGYAADKPLIRNFSISIGPNERIGVIGKNGKGKTTLLRLLAGVLKPNTGEISYNPNVEIGFFEQTNIATLADNRTVVEEIQIASNSSDRQLARNISGAMLFEGDDALKKIGVLSGGEKSRVMLGKLLATPVNVLILDEPTNHLDMQSNDSLLEAIDHFDGVVIMVTHNEMFLHALAERLIVFQTKGTFVFDDNYGRFLDEIGWEEEETPEKTDSKKASDKISKKDIRRKRSEIITERSKVLKPLEKQIETAEDDIEEHENKLNMLNEAMQEATLTNDAARIKELAKAIHFSESLIEKRFEELEKFTEELAEKNVVFAQKLEALDALEN